MNHSAFRVLLAQRGLRQFELAKLLKWRPPKLSAILREYGPVKKSDAEALAKALGVPLSELFPEFLNERKLASE